MESFEIKLDGQYYNVIPGEDIFLIMVEKEEYKYLQMNEDGQWIELNHGAPVNVYDDHVNSLGRLIEKHLD